jgi:hypothetical protein
VRKGAIFGVFMGSVSLILYITYSTGFIFGSFLMHHEGRDELSISNIIVVS